MVLFIKCFREAEPGEEHPGSGKRKPCPLTALQSHWMARTPGVMMLPADVPQLMPHLIGRHRDQRHGSDLVPIRSYPATV